MKDILTVTDLTKIFPRNRLKRPAVDAISFHLKESEILGLLGPNGSGKTTTIHMLLGTLSHTSGTIIYFGRDFGRYRTELLQHISFASAYTSLPWLLTVEENLKLFGRLYSISPKESEDRFDPLLERFGIFEKRHERISSLSAGQITRLMLVKAFFIRPKVILLDEPTASLDPDMANEICSFILEQRDRTGLSILFTSHKMEEATEVCDRVNFSKRGKLSPTMSPKKLAETVSAFRVRLIIIDGMKRIRALAESKKLPFKIDHKTIEITISESDIPEFLHAVSDKKISYANITIEEPSLEEYFLTLVK